MTDNKNNNDKREKWYPDERHLNVPYFAKLMADYLSAELEIKVPVKVCDSFIKFALQRALNKLEEGCFVMLKNFGRFDRVLSKGFKRHNPAKGKVTITPSFYKIVFTPGHSIKKRFKKIPTAAVNPHDPSLDTSKIKNRQCYKSTKKKHKESKLSSNNAKDIAQHINEELDIELYGQLTPEVLNAYINQAD